METAKILDCGHSQTISLPQRVRFSSEEVFVQRVGQAVLLFPKEASWQTFMSGINGFSDDFLADGREPGVFSERDFLRKGGGCGDEDCDWL